MASMINHGYKQAMKTGKIQLFKSYSENLKDGDQSRDFIYVQDIAHIIYWMMNSYKSKEIPSGLYNVGTGQSRTFNDLAKIIFEALNLPVNIEYIDMPEGLRNTYQNYTKADIAKLRTVGYTGQFRSLEEGVYEYLQHIYKDIEWAIP
jgi:ADP-L-glycero-D-manno-heptose 6-epimerase